MTDNRHSAVAPALGYYYQALYALDILLSDPSDEALVYLETKDDVEHRASGQRSLFQLKYSGSSKPVAISDDDFWKTMGIWLPFESEQTHGAPRYFFVTTRPLHPDTELHALTDSGADKKPLYDALIAEARRFTGRASADTSTAKHRSCAAFLDLAQNNALAFLERIRICPSSFFPDSAIERVASHLTNVRAADRDRIADRLIEWWDTQAFRSLMHSHEPAPIHKLELQERITTLIRDLSDSRLFDDFSKKVPDDVWEEAGDTMVAQIRLVDGTNAHIERAAREMWRARSQRGRWMEDEVGFGRELDAYDDELIEEWSDRHSVAKSEVEDEGDIHKKEAGLRLLDWSHVNAPLEVRPIRENWSAYFLVRGTYQLLADDKRVGWHPNYSSLLTEEADDQETLSRNDPDPTATDHDPDAGYADNEND